MSVWFGYHMEYLSFRRTLAKEDNFLGFKCNDVIKNFFVFLKLQCLQVFWSIHGLFFLKFQLSYHKALFGFTYFFGLKSIKLVIVFKVVSWTAHIAKYCFIIWILSSEWYLVDVTYMLWKLQKYSQRKSWSTTRRWFLRYPRGHLYREPNYDLLIIVWDNSNKQVCSTNSDKVDRL